MLLKLILIFVYILNNIKGIEEISEPKSYLNDFMTITENFSFTIRTIYESIAYFDSFDKNCLVYANNIRIDGQFYQIYPNKEYIISVKLFNPESACILQRYLSFDSININIKDKSINYIYFKRDKYYTMNFTSNTIDRIFTLSKKTPNVKVTIGSCELNSINFFCKISKDVKEIKYFISSLGNAFIEIINVIDDEYEILDKQYYDLYKIKSKNTILTIPYTQKNIKIRLGSTQPFKFSFSDGFNNDKNYYYSSINNININAKEKKNYYTNTITFYDIYRKVSLMKGEFFSFSINIEKKENQIVFLNYKESSLIDELMDERLEENYCIDIIKNLKNLFEIYVFSDIAQSPPEFESIPNYHHEQINFKKRLSSVSTKNRKFYEFYQELQLIFGTVRDRHLNIEAKETPLLTQISQYYAALPFDFSITKVQSYYRIFIKINSFYYSYSTTIQQILDKNKYSPIKTINRINPFDFIQNWSKLKNLKGKHAQFTSVFRTISFFYLHSRPLNYSDLSFNEFEFDSGDILRIPYLIRKPIKNDIEFNNYFLNILKSNKEIPRFDEIYDKFLVFKGEKMIQKNEMTTNIDWDINLSHIEGNNLFKCRIDEKNKVNVIYQNTFHFDYLREAVGKMLKCVKTFFNNKYPIIIIESNNGGGYTFAYSVLLQIIQPRIEVRDYTSLRMTPFSEQFFKTYDFYRQTDFLYCSEINSFTDIKKFYQDTYVTNPVMHNRTSAFDALAVDYRLALKEFREEIINNENIKKPTDIIIFTDSYSFSATSAFIKGLQNTGGAVIVGYYGNPQITGTNLFDSSQSPSGVSDLSNSQIKKELEKNGFLLKGVTIEESFPYNPNNAKNAIPMEYHLNPVDFRVDIYSDYSDDIYEQFIQEGLKIHKKLNEENQCNSKNSKLLLYDDKCKYSSGSGGGYKCKYDNTWDKSNCETNYCKIGYYFDQATKTCIENCKFDKEKSFFIYEDNYNKIFDIKQNIRYNFFFPFNKKKYYFVIRNYDNKRIPVTDYFILIWESFDFKLKIEEVKINSNINLLNLNNANTKISSITYKESLIFLNNSEDYILYIDNIYNSSKTKYEIAEYKNEMSYDEMFNHDKKYFSSYKDSIHFFSKDKMYLLYINVPELDPFNIFISPLNKGETIEINGNKTNFLYLEKNKIYTLDFRKNSINRMIKLSRETLKSVVNIINKSFILNSKNLYYELDNNYKGKLTLKVENENALIEFLFRQEDSEIDVLRFNKKTFILNKKYNVMAIPKSYSNKLIDIELTRNEFLTNFTIYLGYSIPPFNYFSIDVEENMIIMEDKLSFTVNEHYKGVNNLMEDEFYCVMIENFGEDVLMKINVQDDGDDSDKDSTIFIKFVGWKMFLLLFFM